MYHRIITSCCVVLTIITHGKSQTKEGDSCVDQFTNTVGRCTTANTCESARRDFQQNGIRPTFCTYSAFGATLVCCRDGTNILQTADAKPLRPLWGSNLNKQTDGRRVSERNDKDISSTTNTPAEPYVHDYAHDDTLSQQAYQHGIVTPQPSQLEDKDIKDREYPPPPDRNTYESEEDLITKLWALKLKKLLSEQRRYAEKIINDVLFQADLGSLTKEHLEWVTKSECNQNIDTLSPTTLKNLIRSTQENSLKSEEKRTTDTSTPILQLKLTVNNPDTP